MNHHPALYLNHSDRGGKGVFTATAIPAGSVIELAPVIVLSPEDRTAIHETRLHDYYFLWAGDGAAIALGYGSLYNHGKPANADFLMDYDFLHIQITARRDIAAGEEILIDYTSGDDREGLWFTPV